MGSAPERRLEPGSGVLWEGSSDPDSGLNRSPRLLLTAGTAPAIPGACYTS